jgi:hypothetical protein
MCNLSNRWHVLIILPLLKNAVILDSDSCGARLDATKRRGERHRNGGYFYSISKRPQNHNMELVHKKRWSHAGNRRARTRGSQRNLLTSPRRTRKNKNLSMTLSSSAAISYSLSIHHKVPNSLEARDICTRNNPPC